MMARAVIAFCIALCASTRSALATPGVPVFYPGLNGSKCYRIPSIIRTSAGTLLAFAENRVSDCGDNGAHHSLVLRRSTDGGKTWGAMITVKEGETPCPGCPAAISNPNPVEVTRSDGSRVILLHFDTMNNPNNAHHGIDMQMWSTDEGLTWSNATAVSYPPLNNTGGLIGPSVGIQDQNGRILFSVVFGSQHWLYWSDDFGKSWAASQPVSGLGECSIAFLVSAADGRVIMNCRTTKQRRAQLVWSAELVPTPSEVVFPDGLIDSGCQGSIINDNGVLFTSNTNTTTERSHLAVKRSADQGAEWSSGVLVWKGPSGYSQLVSLGGGELGVLWEAGEKSYTETISFAVVPKEL